MTEISDRYRRRAEGFTARVAAVPADDPRWADPSPCEGWSAHDVVDHLVGAHRLFFGFVELDVAEGPSAADDPLAAWAHVRDATQAALDDPATAGQEFDGFSGRRPWGDAVDQFVSADVLVHTWDLAKALGGDDRLPAEDVRRVHEALRPLGDRMRQPGAFGPELPAPEDADDQDRLLAFLGRDPRWAPS